jgi:hypothetical protein
MLAAMLITAVGVCVCVCVCVSIMVLRVVTPRTLAGCYQKTHILSTTNFC